ncbi:MAG: hypothetical protein QXI10_00065 [Candidatus Diapherotrites archaeon]
MIRGFFNSFDLVLAFVILLFFVLFVVSFVDFHVVRLFGEMSFLSSFFQSFVFSELAVKQSSFSGNSFGFAYFDFSEKRSLPNIIVLENLKSVGFDSNANCFSFKRIVKPYLSSKVLLEIPFCR